MKTSWNLSCLLVAALAISSHPRPLFQRFGILKRSSLNSSFFVSELFKKKNKRLLPRCKWTASLIQLQYWRAG